MSESDRMPEWAEWVEANALNLALGVKCRDCGSGVWSENSPFSRDDYPVGNATTALIHEDDCKHSDVNAEVNP